MLVVTNIILHIEMKQVGEEVHSLRIKLLINYSLLLEAVEVQWVVVMVGVVEDQQDTLTVDLENMVVVKVVIANQVNHHQEMVEVHVVDM